MNKMPNVSNQNIIDRKGAALLEAQFSDQMIFISHPGNTDFGIDYSVELIKPDSKTTSGYFVCIQLKSHNKIVFNSDGCFKQQVRTTIINYWLSINMPVIMVLADLANKTLYGIDVKRRIRQSYDFDKMEKQETISISINRDDVFSYKTCLCSIIEFEKYNTLYTSAIDSLNIFNFIIYTRDYSHRDWFLLVDDYDDYTNEILALVDKYYWPFSLNNELVELRRKMLNVLETHMMNGRLDYDEYIEKDRVDFNNVAIDYMIKLTEEICCEMDQDKTNALANKLFKFKRLNKMIKCLGRPSFENAQWDHVCLNQLNSDYDDNID